MYQRLYSWLYRVALAICVTGVSAAVTEARITPSKDNLPTILKFAKNDTDKINILLIKARDTIMADVGNEFFYANTALGISDKLGWIKGKMLAEELIGGCYNKVKRYHDAINYFNLAINDAKKIDSTQMMERCMQQMARSYRGLGDLQNMNRCQQAAFHIAEKVGKPADIAFQMRTCGLFLSEAGQYREAIEWVRKDVSYAEAHFSGDEKVNFIGDSYNIMAGAFLKINGADSALYYLRIAERFFKKTGNEPRRAYVLSTFCDVYQSVNRYDSAIIYGEQTIKMGEQFKNLDLQQYYCKTLSKIFEDDNKPIQALYYHKRYDSLINIIDNGQKLVDQAIQLSDIDIEQEAQHQKQEKESFEIIKSNQQIALMAAVAAILAFIVLTIYIYYNLKQKQNVNKIISRQSEDLLKQNELIDKALREKEILLKETHHRVKNNLQLIVSLLELQSANLEDEQAKNALYLAQQRVLSIATVHSKLYGDYEVGDIDFSSFVTELFARLNSAFGNTNNPVKFENEIPTVSFALNTIVLLGIILNELITNSFKHAFKHSARGRVKISLTQADGLYTLRYYDNGPGLNEELFNNDSGTLGLYLVRRLSKQLKGSASYRFEAGSIFTINFLDIGN